MIVAFEQYICLCSRRFQILWGELLRHVIDRISHSYFYSVSVHDSIDIARVLGSVCGKLARITVVSTEFLLHTCKIFDI